MRLFHLARLSLLALLVSLIPASSHAGIFISVGFAPPVMPVYVQPPCPEPGLMWTPGYWHYGEMGYYWVPGAWVPAPAPGLLWTPGYWGWSNGFYIFHGGYWGRHVGYYGGVNYGFGYMGMGFAGGEWRGGVFNYNTAVVNVNTTVIHNTYVNTTIVHNTTIVNNNHTAYSGGPGGINHPPTPQEQAVEHEPHQPPSAVQQQHLQAAQHSPSSWAKNNGGHPTTLAVAKPLSPSRPMPEAPVGQRSHTPPAAEAPKGGHSGQDDWCCAPTSVAKNPSGLPISTGAAKSQAVDGMAQKPNSATGSGSQGASASALKSKSSMDNWSSPTNSAHPPTHRTTQANPAHTTAPNPPAHNTAPPKPANHSAPPKPKPEPRK